MDDPLIPSMDDTMASSVFQRANQSVDDFLKEIQGDTTDPFDISLPDLQHKPSSPLTLPLNVDNSVLPLELNGPREFVDSPKKKQVTIDSNPPTEVEFIQLSEYEGDESNSDQSLDQLKTTWEKVEPKQQPWNDNKFNPLPRITNSNSMPNIEIEFDSEQTMVPSPSSPHKTSTTTVNKVTYDHSHYIQDMEGANYQKYSNEKTDLDKLKNDIAVLPDLKPIDEVKRLELINGFKNQEGDDDNVKRTDSLKSTMSILETSLTTKTVKKSVISIEVPNSKYEEDYEIIERTFNEVKEVNDLDVSDNDDTPSEQILNIPKHQHKRSSSLSDMVGNFIRSMSSKSISAQKDVDEDDNVFTKPPTEMFASATTGRVPSSRIVSGVSVATTNTEGFVSAQEELENENIEDRFIDINQNELNDVVDNTDEVDADVTIISNGVAPETESETDHSLNKVDKVDLKELKIDSPDSSFNSDKFVLKTSFEDDVYTNEFEEFNKSLGLKSRISSTSTTSNPKRIQSFELCERNEILNIWNTQSPQTSSTKLSEFDSINSPIKSSIISTQKAREIKRLKESSNRKNSRAPSDELIPSKWILKKLEVIPTSASHSRSKSFGSIHTMDRLIVNPLFNSDEGLSHYKNAQLDDVDISNGTIIHNDDYSAIKFDDSLLNNRSELLNAELSTGLSDMDDSLLKIINKWDPIESNVEVQSHDQSNKDILNKVWNPNSENSEIKTHSNHLSEDFEGYIQQKRIISDDFKVKSAQTGKVHYHTMKSSPIEQNGMIYHLDNLSYSNLIPELGITQQPSAKNTIVNPIEQQGDVSLDSFKTANSMMLLTPKKQTTMADTMRPQLSPEKVNNLNVSPAHKKIQEKKDQQVEMKREQVRHQKLQSQLQKNLREEAKILAEMYPKREKSIKVVKGQLEQQQPNEELFEQFTTPIKDNPFESPVKSPLETNISEPLDRKIIELKSKLIDGERGRLFFKISGLKDIKLPTVANKNCKFQMVLDNGIHRLVTDFIDFKSNKFINIDKEFELIVADKLDIIITLKLKYEKPKAQRYTVAEKKTVKSKSKLGRLFGRKETQIVNREVVKEPAHDPLSDWMANDGSFGKLKIDFDDFENDTLGKPTDFSLKCYNEWKVYNDTRGKTVQIKSPVEVCSIDFKMLYIPRSTRGEILPISISNALDQAKECNEVDNIKNEGFMYQEGGDLDSWTRRYYKLDGFDLLAFSDLNGKLKAKINLKKINEIISGSVTTSRKFSESLKLNNGFKVIFGDDETIEFGCDSKDQMEQWIEILNQLIVLNNFQRQPWLQLMIQNNITV